MTTLVEIAYNIILPIFIIVGISVVFDRVFEPDARTLSRVTLYVFSPFLVLDRMSKADLGADEAGQLATVAICSALLVAFVAWQLARLAGFDRRLESAFVLSAVLLNGGNYGLSLNRFAFGEAGEERAIVYFVIAISISNTLGVYLASRGSVPTRRALRNVVMVPLPYAAVAGILLNVGNISLPLPLDRSFELLGQAAIPSMLVVLGVQLSRASIHMERLRAVVMVTGVRLIISPIIALGLLTVLGATGLTRDVAVVQAAMPTAVISGVLATEFGGDAEFVTSVILTSTLVSIVTLTVLLALLT